MRAQKKLLGTSIRMKMIERILEVSLDRVASIYCDAIVGGWFE